MRVKKNLFLSLDGEKKLPSGKKNRCFLAACAPGRDRCRTRDLPPKESFPAAMTR
jgi:hypothetical protein